MRQNTVTCSFSMDRDTYNAYKSIIARNGENVKGNIVRYMKSVIQYDTPNTETIAAIEEVQRLKADPNKKAYNNFEELLADIDFEDMGA
ncbi:MAG: hypothetical protein J6M92_05355 [Oribacterium sp.]|nr:hypothetical protein [Oribacterium sp.]